MEKLQTISVFIPERRHLVLKGCLKGRRLAHTPSNWTCLLWRPFTDSRLWKREQKSKLLSSSCPTEMNPMLHVRQQESSSLFTPPLRFVGSGNRGILRTAPSPWMSMQLSCKHLCSERNNVKIKLRCNIVLELIKLNSVQFISIVPRHFTKVRLRPYRIM